ncbi:MAG: aromatic aminobenezylarsenical efflux permease ArsG family transporter [Candidatus Omnitrophota bacterium]
MAEWLFGAASALWLGILTSISPCPLASNIAAMSYIGRKMDRPLWVLGTGVFYTLGRMTTYVVLGALIASSFLSIPQLSFFLQKYMNKILGPLLILTGMFLLELLSMNLGNGRMSQWAQKRADSGGLWGAGLLGMIFALAFCPVSAALFFGGLIPLAVKMRSGFAAPALYGAGTALPVAAFAFIIALGAFSLGRAYQRIAQFEWWARMVTGTIFILAGMYYCIIHIFGIAIPFPA